MTQSQVLNYCRSKSKDEMVESEIITHKPTDTRWKIRWYPNGTKFTEKPNYCALYLDLFRKPMRYEAFRSEYEFYIPETDDAFCANKDINGRVTHGYHSVLNIDEAKQKSTLTITATIYITEVVMKDKSVIPFKDAYPNAQPYQYQTDASSLTIIPRNTVPSAKSNKYVSMSSKKSHPKTHECNERTQHRIATNASQNCTKFCTEG